MSDDDLSYELPVTWCVPCQADVQPYGRGKCPRCHKYVKGSFGARKHPVNVLRRDQLLSHLVAEFQPSTLILRHTCEHLAAVYEQLENTRPGRIEHTRLLADATRLSTILEGARRASPSVSLPEALAGLTQEALVARLEELLVSARRHAAPSTTPPQGDPAIRRFASTVDEPMGPPSQNIHISAEIADPETSGLKPDSPEPETTPLVNSEAAPTIPSTPTAPLPTGNKSASPIASVILETKRTAPVVPDPIEAERRAAAIRESLGWNVGVVSPNGIRRNRE